MCAYLFRADLGPFWCRCLSLPELLRFRPLPQAMPKRWKREKGDSPILPVPVLPSRQASEQLLSSFWQGGDATLQSQRPLQRQGPRGYQPQVQRGEASASWPHGRCD